MLFPRGSLALILAVASGCLGGGEDVGEPEFVAGTARLADGIVFDDGNAEYTTSYTCTPVAGVKYCYFTYKTTLSDLVFHDDILADARVATFKVWPVGQMYWPDGVHQFDVDVSYGWFKTKSYLYLGKVDNPTPTGGGGFYTPPGTWKFVMQRPKYRYYPGDRDLVTAKVKFVLVNEPDPPEWIRNMP